MQSEYHTFLRDCPAHLRCCPLAAYARYYRSRAPRIYRRGILSKIFDRTCAAHGILIVLGSPASTRPFIAYSLSLVQNQHKNELFDVLRGMFR